MKEKIFSVAVRVTVLMGVMFGTLYLYQKIASPVIWILHFGHIAISIIFPLIAQPYFYRAKHQILRWCL